jgi:hypothetical protein
MFFQESLAFGSYRVNALMEYSRVLERPSANNPLYAFALMRVAEIAERTGEREKAKMAYEQIATELPASAPAAEVPRWVRSSE